MTDKVDRVARAIYNLFVFDEPTGAKPDWVVRGNSLKQDEARRMARDAIAAMPLCDALAKIARGDPNGGSPLAGEKARQLARGAMIDLGLDW